MANNNFLSTFGFIFVLISIGHAVPTHKGDFDAPLENGHAVVCNGYVVNDGCPLMASSSSSAEDGDVGHAAACNNSDVVDSGCLSASSTTTTTTSEDVENLVENNAEWMEVFVEDAKDWAYRVGMIVKPKEHLGSSDTSQFAPFALFPTKIPRELFHQAVGVQEALTLLYFRASCDYEFLVKHLTEASQTDEVLRKLMDIHEEVHREGVIRQPISMVFQRADYMFHTKNDTEEEYELKQIEVNSGAVAGLLIQRVTEVHRRVLTKAQLPTTTEFLPENNPIGNVALGLYTAWKAFGNPNAIMVMVVSKIGSPNHYEQRLVEYELERISSGQMEVVRLRHTECAQRLHLAKDFTLMLGNRVVSVVYFRVSHLATKDYDGDTFEGRRMIDRSTAIKCPSIGMLLANTKKVQQALTMPGMLEHFFPLPEETKMIVAIRSTFADMWGLDKSDKKTRRVIKDAIAHPDRYVLKPNKEGGGNNFWGPDIADKLITMPHAELAKHILMQKLKPMVSQNYFIRPFLAPEFGPVVSELGVFGALVGNQVTGRVLYNRSQGHAMRTKWERVHEGGISCGSAVYDSPYLVV